MTVSDKLSLKDLRILGFNSRGHKLIEIYGNASVPENMLGLVGDPVGMGICLHIKSRFSLKNIFSRWLYNWAEKDSFPWHGKSFRSISAQEGYGFNRFNFWGLSALPFKTKIGNSLVDGKPCIQITYQLKVNPKSQMNLYDELREISPGIFFGPVYTNRSNKKIICWFGVDFNQQVIFPPLIPIEK